MAVNETGEHHVVLELNDFLGKIAGEEVVSRTYLQDLAAVHSHGRIGPIAHALSFHRVEMGGAYQFIDLLHGVLLMAQK